MLYSPLFGMSFIQVLWVLDFPGQIVRYHVLFSNAGILPLEFKDSYKYWWKNIIIFIETITFIKLDIVCRWTYELSDYATCEI